MAELEEIKELLQNHIASSNEWRSEISDKVTRIDVHSAYSKERLETHEKDIAELKSTHNKQKGALWVFGLIGGSTAVKVIADIFK